MYGDKYELETTLVRQFYDEILPEGNGNEIWWEVNLLIQRNSWCLLVVWNGI